MTLKSTLQNGFNSLIQRAGKQIGVTYYTQVIGSVWDDDTALSISGTTIWTSGIVLPIGQADSVLMQQGKLLDNDQRLYVNGSLSFTGSELQVEIQLGSATTTDQIFTTIPGGISPEVDDTRIYKKIYIRRLKIGSLIGR